MDKPIVRGRWVCPNDRYLALRSILQTGWSVKTDLLDTQWRERLNSSTSNPNNYRQSLLTEDERQSIIQVIQRAEALDLSEQERVGRLVERLENMKRNVCIVTSMRSKERRGCGSRCSSEAHCMCSCALCGEKFGTILGTIASLCKDCHKYVCQKCGIETMRVNSLRVSSSDGSDGENVATPSCSTLRVIKLAKEKTAVQRIFQRFHGNAQKQFLCRICAETREMWKKSGAWFFKGMPKYILPEKKERGWSRTSHKTSTWTIIGNTARSLESTDQQDSSSDDDTTRRLRMVPISPTNLPSNRESSSKPRISNPTTTITPSRRISRGKSNGLHPAGYHDDDYHKLGRSCLSTASQCSPISSTGSIGTFPSRINSKSTNNVHVEQHVSFENVSFEDEEANEPNEANEANDDEENVQQSRKDTYSVDRLKNSQVQSLRLKKSTASSSAATSLTTPIERFQIHWRSTERDGNRFCLEQNNSPSGSQSNNQVQMPKIQTLECPQDTGQDLGTLEISLRYDPADQCLYCKVIRARHLIPMDIQGFADPFCKLNILPIGKAATSMRLKTKTVHRTCDPEFNEIVNFYETTESDISSDKALHVLIIQDDPSGNDFLGEARFPLHELQPYQTKHYKVPLQDHYQVDNEEEVWGICSRQIQISLCYCTHRSALLVMVHRATNLHPIGNNGFPDPFVKLCLIKNATDNHQQKNFLVYSNARATAKRLTSKKNANRTLHSTSIKRKTLNPEWNEEFVFTNRLTELMNLTLCFSVWDKGFAKKNVYLGGLMLGSSSKGARFRHWIDMIKFPNHHHLAWHNLAEVDIPIE